MRHLAVICLVAIGLSACERQPWQNIADCMDDGGPFYQCKHYYLVLKHYDPSYSLEDAEELKSLREVAAQGLAEAQHELAIRHLAGIRGVLYDKAEAAKLFRKAAEQGFIDAQFELARMYANGSGVAQNKAEAFKWYSKAANPPLSVYCQGSNCIGSSGHPRAQIQLGEAYRNGWGVTKNNDAALFWFRKAAEQGDANAWRYIEKLKPK